MRVPVANNFSESPSIAPGIRLNAPQVSNAAAEQIQQVGNVVQQGAQGLARIQTDILQDANRLRLDEAMTQAQQARLIRMQEVKALKGKDALYRGDKPLDEEYDNLLNQDLEAIGKTLGNDAQKQAWALESGAMRRQFRGEVAGHMAAEHKTYDDQVQQGKISTGLQLMQQSYDNPNDWDTARGVISDAVARLNAGSPPDYLKAETVKALTPGHVSVVQSMLQGNQVQAARDYFARPDVQAELTPEARVHLSEVLTVASADIMAEQAVQEVIGAMGDGWTPAEADKQLSSRFASDPATLKTARNLLNYQDGLRDDARKEYTRRLTEPVERLLGDADRSGGLISTSAPELVALRGRDAEAYRIYSDRVAAHNEQVRSRSQARDKRMAEITGQNTEENASAILFDMAANPGAYKGKPIDGSLREAVKSGKLLPSDALRIQNHWNDIQAGNKTPELATFSTAESYLNDLLDGAYISKGTGDTPKAYKELDKTEQAALKSSVRLAIDRALADAQVTEGRKYNNAEVRGVVLNAFRQATLVNKPLIGRDEKTPMLVADPEGIGPRVGVTVNYNMIPADTRAAIESVLRKNRKPVTKQSVIEYYNALGK